MPSTKWCGNCLTATTLSILHWRCSWFYDALAREYDVFQYSIGDARGVGEVEAKAEALSTFNTPLEMRQRGALVTWRCGGCSFQYSIGDARRRNIVCGDAGKTFQYSIGDAPPQRTTTGRLSACWLSILHWRCRGQEREGEVLASGNFQYSIGDAKQVLTITPQEVVLLSILHWRCDRAAAVIFYHHMSYVFQYSIGDAKHLVLLRPAVHCRAFFQYSIGDASGFTGTARRVETLFQYSIGDALTALADFTSAQIPVFQYSIGDA